MRDSGLEIADQSVIASRLDGGVLHLELNRPHARNAVNDDLSQRLGDLLHEFDQDPELRVAVLSGRGPGFCAGLDLKAFLSGETGEHPVRGFAGLTGKPPEKPIIAAVEGFALAGGFEMAVCCDLIVAAEDAKLGLPEVQRGVIADGGALLHLPRRVPYQWVMELALTGEPISGTLAAARGFIARAVPAGNAVSEALNLAVRIARNAPLSVLATKRIISEGRDWDLGVATEEQLRISEPVWRSRDAEEGARAFAEKRAPAYRGE